MYCPFSSVVERLSCKQKVPSSILGTGIFFLVERLIKTYLKDTKHVISNEVKCFVSKNGLPGQNNMHRLYFF